MHMEAFPGWFLKSAYMFYAFGALLVLVPLYQLVRGRANISEALYMVVMAAWPIGLAAKATETGPEIFRYWLADIGFPLAIGWALWDVYWRLTRSRRNDYRPDFGGGYVGSIRKEMYMLSGRSYALVIGLVLSMLYEFILGGMAAKVNEGLPPGQRSVVGEFDWLDVLMYICGLLCGLGLLLGRRWRVLRLVGLAAQMDAAQEAVGRRTSARLRTDAQRDRRKTKRKKNT
jgi:hypothetical protein